MRLMTILFPTIEHLDQVREAISGRDDFYIAERDGHYIANYLVQYHDTFPNPFEEGISVSEKTRRMILRECRGIIFDANGKIIRRPFNKFFNYGEKQDELGMFDFTQDHVVCEKYDGSLIAPYIVNGKMIFGTKMGNTHLVPLVDDFLKDKNNYKDFANEMIEYGVTPMFEICTRKQRIVIDYPEDKLVLTAMRNMISGEYISLESMRNVAENFDIPVMNTYGTVDDIDAFMQKVSALEDIEGYVIRFGNGLQCKMKASLYLMLHRTLDGLSSEKNAIQLILEDRLDDAKPLLADYIRNGVEKFSDDLNRHIQKIVNYIVDVVSDAKTCNLTKKEFAVNVILSNEEYKKYSSVFFNAFDDVSLSREKIRENVIKQILSVSSNSTKLEQNRHWIGDMHWKDYLNLKMDGD